MTIDEVPLARDHWQRVHEDAYAALARAERSLQVVREAEEAARAALNMAQTELLALLAKGEATL